MLQKDLGLADLVNLADWQKIQDTFSEVLEISIKTISLEGSHLTKTSRPCKISSDILSKIPNTINFCANPLSDEALKSLVSAVKNGGNFKYPFGLDLFIIPIEAFGNRVAAYMLLGPLILKNRKAISEYVKDAERSAVKFEDLMDALIEINVFSYNKVYSMINLVKDIFSHMAQTGYHKKRLGVIARQVVEMDPLFSRYYEEKILNSLLNSCTLALGADSGSVMTLDKNTNMLHIKVASKLDEEIINKTEIRVGEGIAGVVAATAKPIILPKDKNKNGLSKQMKRRDIKSSMIVPFNKGNTADVYGVINLNIMRKNVDFCDRDITLVKELVNMASIALISLYQSSPDSSKS